MKLNFWQILGVILVVIGAIGYAMFKDDGKKKDTAAPTETPAPATPPATQPVP